MALTVQSKTCPTAHRPPTKSNGPGRQPGDTLDAFAARATPVMGADEVDAYLAELDEPKRSTLEPYAGRSGPW